MVELLPGNNLNFVVDNKRKRLPVQHVHVKLASNFLDYMYGAINTAAANPGCLLVGHQDYELIEENFCITLYRYPMAFPVGNKIVQCFSNSKCFRIVERPIALVDPDP